HRAGHHVRRQRHYRQLPDRCLRIVLTHRTAAPSSHRATRADAPVAPPPAPPTRPTGKPRAGRANGWMRRWKYGCSMPPLSVVFAGASTGRWSIERLETVAGSPLAPASRLEVIESPRAARPADAGGVLRGVTSNERYVTAAEHRELVARQEPLGRAGATRAALIPVRKSEAWWDLAQDERRRIFEESSHHIATGLEYLPAVARRLHHG